jgi:UDP-glucose 4-epimerase
MRRMAGVDFSTENVGRRTGDAVTVVANAERARRELGWTPKHDDLDFIVRTALEWEDALTRRNRL